jgi:flagellar hook-associated protein 2
MSAVDGLITGMDTSAVIRQLMQLERIPVVRLQSRKTATDKAITALQSINTKFLALAELAKKLNTTAGMSRVTSSTSHPNLLSATVTEGTAPASLTFRVNSLAAAHQIYSASTYASTTDQVSQAGRDITIGYTDANGAAASVIVNDHDGSLSSVAAAINAAADSPITARVVKTSDAGDYRLELTAKSSGAASAFTVTGIRNPPADMTFQVATQASDAEILFGSSATPMSLTSSTNTITGVAPGVTLNLLKADPATTVTVDITRDTATIADDVEKLVNAANEILKDIKALTAAGSEGRPAGALRGAPAVRRLQDQLLTAVSNAVGGTSAATAGLQLTRDGTLTFDKAKFTTAYDADPVGTAALFKGGSGSDGIATRLIAVATAATRSTDGVLTTAIESRRREIRRIDDNIATWDVRLAAKEKRLRLQFAALETALGSAQQQGNWLAGQINSLPKWDS